MLRTVNGFESRTVHTKLKLMEKFWKRFELKNFIDEQLKDYGVFDAYSQPSDCTGILYFIEDKILNKVEELYV